MRSRTKICIRLCIGPPEHRGAGLRTRRSKRQAFDIKGIVSRQVPNQFHDHRVVRGLGAWNRRPIHEVPEPDEGWVQQIYTRWYFSTC
jgi:hypothetical protein